LRPVRFARQAWPTIPSVSAAIAGGKIEAAAPMSACEATTTGKLGSRIIARQPAATAPAAIATAARFQRIRSISAPANDCVAIVPTSIAAIATPTFDGSQCCREVR